MAEFDVARLREVAEAATPGPWPLIGGGEYVADVGIVVAPDDGGVTPADATFIAAWNPVTAKAVLDRLAEAEAVIANALSEQEKWGKYSRTHAILAAYTKGTEQQ